MSPDTRQKLHALFDQMLDVIADAKNEEPRKRKRREMKISGIPLTEDDFKRALEVGRKVGLL